MHERSWRAVRAMVGFVCAIVLVIPGVGRAEEPSRTPVVSWETGDGKSYIIPAAEVAAFIAALNFVDRNVLRDWRDYDVTGESISRNLHTTPVFDRDPFSVNQIGHPYQGSVYYGLARSAGLSYWESLLYTIGGSVIWEFAGETTPPSINDMVTTGIGGSFVGEAAFRMASLLLE